MKEGIKTTPAIGSPYISVLSNAYSQESLSTISQDMGLSAMAPQLKRQFTSTFQNSVALAEPCIGIWYLLSRLDAPNTLQAAQYP